MLARLGGVGLLACLAAAGGARAGALDDVAASTKTATDAVEKKGKDVLATIPDDYSDTLSRISALESCGFVVVNGKICMKYVKS